MIKITYIILGIISLIAVVGTPSISSHAFAVVSVPTQTSTDPTQTLADDIKSLPDQANTEAKSLSDKATTDAKTFSDKATTEAKSLSDKAQSLADQLRLQTSVPSTTNSGQ